MKFLFAITVLFLFGCKTIPKPVDNYSILNKTLALENGIVVLNEHSFIVELDGLKGDGAGIDAATHSAIHSAAATPGYSAAGGFVGSLVGIGIMRGLQDSEAQKAKNKPMEYVLQRLNSIALETIIKNNGKAPEHNPIDLRIEKTPVFSITADYRALHLSILFEVLKSKKVVNRNFYHVYSKPIPIQKGDIVLSWNNYLDNGIEMVLEEMWSDANAMLKSSTIDQRYHQKANNAIEYYNDSGRFYERGKIIQKSGNKLIYKDLRGEIKQVYIDAKQ